MTLTLLRKTNLGFLAELLAEHASIEASVLYGSVARGDVESHSDIDLLVLCSEGRKLSLLDQLKAMLGRRFDHLSITIYSRRELAFLNSAKSLFLLHLSREGIFLFDKRGFLRDLLADFQPKRSYRSDFEKSIRLADPLQTVVEGAPNNLHRLSYVYSLFRVYGVYLLAERGIYEFSKSRMVQLLSCNFPDSRPHVEMLSNLRPLNSNFFVGGSPEPEGSQSWQSLTDTVSALGSMVATTLQVKPLPYAGAVDEFEKEIRDGSRGLNYRLRMWFLLLAYDGFNLYCRKVGRKGLMNLAETSLLDLTQVDGPDPIARAARETIKYIHRYPLKYFLDEESKISGQIACHLLKEMSDLVEKD